eukprot:6008177-Prymnesium_polylepis.1
MTGSYRIHMTGSFSCTVPSRCAVAVGRVVYDVQTCGYPAGGTVHSVPVRALRVRCKGKLCRAYLVKAFMLNCKDSVDSHSASYSSSHERDNRVPHNPCPAVWLSTGRPDRVMGMGAHNI